MFAPNRLNSNNNNDDNDNDDDVFFNVFLSMKYFIPLQANFKRLFLIVSQPFFFFFFFCKLEVSFKRTLYWENTLSLHTVEGRAIYLSASLIQVPF